MRFEVVTDFETVGVVALAFWRLSETFDAVVTMLGRYECEKRQCWCREELSYSSKVSFVLNRSSTDEECESNVVLTPGQKEAPQFSSWI